MAYLTRWRMLHAARLLREPRAGVAQVAEKVGYTSEAAFAKAFKRTVGGRPERSGDRPSDRAVAQRMLPVWPSE